MSRKLYLFLTNR